MAEVLQFFSSTVHFSLKFKYDRELSKITFACLFDGKYISDFNLA